MSKPFNPMAQFGSSLPTTDFERVRDGRNSLPLWLDVDLTTARSISANTHLILDIAGNSFYIDNDSDNVGAAIVHFQDTTLGRASAPFTAGAGFIAKVGFTSLLIENSAQSGKRLRIFYGVDIDFQVGINASVQAVNTSEVRKSFTNAQKTVTNVSTQILAAKSTRDYLLIQNNDAAGIIYIGFGGAVTTAAGVKIGPGGSYELSSTVPTDAIYAVGSLATQSNVVAVEA